MIFKIFWIIRALIYKAFIGKIGFPSYIGKPVYLGRINRVFIGKKVRIFPGARIEVIDNLSSIVFEDDISVGQNLHIISGGNLIIKTRTTISANVFISNLDHDYKAIEVHILEQPNIIRETLIGENCFIGYGAVIQAGTILGNHCIVGSNSVVRGSFPDYSVIVGAPAKVVKRYNADKKQWEKTNPEGTFI
ncbi:acyltransferase [Flavobacterium cupreum]|uniref:Acyltransferase n=1 Tax=Flavobacterium cupreum TaxID=2133766 RepID=A0A434A7P2_9FLAO|nr:acyltransferase [Flavobacterium cupreum]RUT70403.1 acyltransferase [Flavobacterium cupreum]